MALLFDAFVDLMEGLSDLLNEIVLFSSSMFRSLEMIVPGLVTGLLMLVLLLSMLFF